MRTVSLLVAAMWLSIAAAAQPKVHTEWVDVDPETVGRYHKTEVGIALPPMLSAAIRKWSDGQAGGVNPFDPRALDVSAVVEHQNSEGAWVVLDTLFGFYYQDYRRSHPIQGPASAYDDNNKVNNYGVWDWKPKGTTLPFRLRYAPREVGAHRLQVRVRGGGLDRLSEWMTFTCVPSASKGFIKRAANSRYLEYADGSLFFPIGHNDGPLDAEVDWKLHYAKDADGELCCDACVKSQQPWGRTQWSKVPLAMVSFVITQDHLKELKAQGANTMRIIGRPFGFELEYETLGDYRGRLHIGWELDRLLELAESLDMKIQFCMDDQFSFELDNSFGFVHWDWWDNYNPKKPGSTATNAGYCYHTELDLEHPIDFLTDQEAYRWYENRLRYYYARWGYSPAISAFELVSEVNGFDNNSPHTDYGIDTTLQVAIADWQAHMARYIKHDLGHDEHLLGVSYLVDGTRGQDYSYAIPEVDLQCESHYFTTFHDHLHLGEGRTNTIAKPLLWTEYGFGNPELKCSRPVNAIKCAMLTPFTGVAGMGMHWDNQFNPDHSHWEVYGHVSGFLDGLDLNVSDWTSHGSLRKDNTASAVYLGTGSAKDKTLRVVGAVYNHTWNEYATRVCPENCRAVPEKCACDSLTWNAWRISEHYQTQAGVSANLRGPNKLAVEDLGSRFLSKRPLKIRWYSPFTGEYGEVFELKRTLGGDLVLPFPDLDPAVNPILFFEVWSAELSGVK